METASPAMTSSPKLANHDLRLWSTGLISGVAASLPLLSWPIVALGVSYWILWAAGKRRQAPLATADTLRVAAGWLLAVMLCNLLLNWSSFCAGFWDGWQTYS